MDQKVDEVLGQTIAQVRKSKGMSRAEVAQALGVTRQAVWNLETGKRPVRVSELLGLAEAMKASPARFLALIFGPGTIRDLTSFSKARREVSSDYAHSILSTARWAKANLKTLADGLGLALAEVETLAEGWAEQRPRTPAIWEEPAASRSEPKPRKRTTTKRRKK